MGSSLVPPHVTGQLISAPSPSAWGVGPAIAVPTPHGERWIMGTVVRVDGNGAVSGRKLVVAGA